jgi:hypothetical protein
VNVFVRADMSPFMSNHIGNLPTVVCSDRWPVGIDSPPGGQDIVVRMVRPYNVWMLMCPSIPGADLTADAMDPSDEENLVL